MSKLDRKDFAVGGSLTKAQLLDQFKRHLEREYPTDVQIKDTIFTVTVEGVGAPPPVAETKSKQAK